MKKILLLLALVLLATGASGALWKKGPEVAQTGLVLAYNLSESSGAVLDKSGNGYNGVNIGGTVGVQAVFGYGYTFKNNGTNTGNADNHAVLLAKTIGISQTQNASACFWAKLDTAPSIYGTLISLGNSTKHPWTIIYYPAVNGIWFRTTNSTDQINNIAYAMAFPSTFTHFCAVTDYTNNNASIYVNGVFGNSSYVKNPYMRIPTTNRSIGNYVDVDGLKYYGMNGTVDEVIIFNRVLTGEEIQNLYEAGITQLNITAPVNGTTIVKGTQYNMTSIIGVAPPLINITYTNETKDQITIYDSHLVGYWTFNNQTLLGEDDTKVADLSYNGQNTCYWKGNSSLNTGKYELGRSNKLYESTILNCSINNNLRPANNFSYSFWVNVRQVNGANMLIVNGLGDDDDMGVEVYIGDVGINGYQPSLELHNNSNINHGQILTSKVLVNQSLNEWVHVVWTVNDSWTFAYINGEQIPDNQMFHGIGAGGVTWTEPNGTINVRYNATEPMYIGNGHGTDSANATLDNVMIWDIILSPEQARQLYLSQIKKLNGTHWNYITSLDTQNSSNITVRACGGNALVTCSEKNNYFIISPSTPTATLDLPVDGTTRESPVEFRCTPNTLTGNFANATFKIYNATALYTSTLNDTSGAGQKSITGITLPDGSYYWTCIVCDTGSPSCGGPSNNTLTINTILADTGDESGDCITNLGYALTYSMNTENHILLDLSAASAYFYNSSLTNVWSGSNALYKYKDNWLVVNTSVNKSGVIYIGSFSSVHNYPTRTPTSDKNYTLSISNFTQQNPCYIVRIKDERDDTFWNYSISNSHYLDTYCFNYAPDRWDLKNTYRVTTLLVCTKENPWFHGILDGSFHRKYETLSRSEDVRLYFLPNTTLTWNKDYYLEDYTGQFGDSYFRVVEKVNGTLRTIWQKKWYNLLVEDVSLWNGTYVEYVVYTPSDTRVIAWDNILNNDSRTISIHEYSWGGVNDMAAGLKAGFTSSYAASTVGINWNLTDGGDVSSVVFKVYDQNTSSGEYSLNYTATLSNPADSGSITYTVSDNNKTYYLAAEVTTSNHGTRSLSQIETLNIMQDAEGPFYGTINIPSTVMGISRESIYTGVSMLLITMAAMMFSAVNVGTGGLVVVAILGVVTFFQWFREMTWAIFLFVFSIAVLEKFTEGRRKT